MKLRICVSEEHYDEVKKYLENHGIEIGDDAAFAVTEITGDAAISSSESSSGNNAAEVAGSIPVACYQKPR